MIELITFLSMFSFAIGYIVMGPEIGGVDWSFWIEYMSSVPANDTGVQEGAYAADQSGFAHTQFDSVTKLGPIDGTYDPELASWLTSEGI